MSLSRYYGKKARRLSVDDETFMWRVRHRHTVSAELYPGCIEILELRRFRAPGRLTLIFAPGLQPGIATQSMLPRHANVTATPANSPKGSGHHGGRPINCGQLRARTRIGAGRLVHQ